MKKNKRLVILLIILIVAAVGAHWCLWKKDKHFGSKIVTQNNQTQNNIPAGWTKYTSPQLGIEFNYPKEWGSPTTKLERGWDGQKNDYSDALTRGITVGFGELSKYLSLGSEPFPPPADGSVTGIIWSPNLAKDKLTDFCESRKSYIEVANCRIFLNKNSLLVVNVVHSGVRMTESNQPETVFKSPRYYYHVYLGNKNYSGVTFAFGGNGVVLDKATMDSVINSIKIIK